jgi:hypothetical protein
MKDPAHRDFIFYRAGLNYIFMHELPAEHPQEPPAEGPWPTTSGTLCEVRSPHELIRDVHEYGSDDATHYRPK